MIRYKKDKRGFTLLEIIVTLVIIGVLASLALPRFFGMTNIAKAQEPLKVFDVIRRSMHDCAIRRNPSASGTINFTGCNSFPAIGMDDPNTADSKFSYAILSASSDFFSITASSGGTDMILFRYRKSGLSGRGGCTGAPTSCIKGYGKFSSIVISSN